MEDKYREIFDVFLKHKLDYMLMGGLALVLYGSVRATFDVDVIIKRDKNEIKKLLNAMSELNFIPRQPTLTTVDAIANLKRRQCITYSSRSGDMQIDIFLETINKFNKLSVGKEKRIIWGKTVYLASLDVIRKLKKKAGREVDKMDLEFIRIRKKIAIKQLK